MSAGVPGFYPANGGASMARPPTGPATSRRHGINVLDVRLVAAGVIPRTTSGKLARRACGAEYLDGTLGAR